jgi:DNA modification methylase
MMETQTTVDGWKGAKVLEPLLRPTSDLQIDPENLRQHDDRNLQAIAKSLQRFGQQKPIVVDTEGRIVAGNGTHQAAVEILHWTHLAVVTTTLTARERKAYAIADNRSAELAAWDMDGLGKVLAEMAITDAEMFSATGFDEADLVNLRGPQDGLTDPDDVPAPPDEAVTKPGDVWILGNHRLLCGDSSKAEDVDRLLDGSHIHLCNCDPPYNVKVEPRSNNAIASGGTGLPHPSAATAVGAQVNAQGRTHHQSFDVHRQGEKKKTTSQMRAKDRPLANDFVSDEAFQKMLLAWFGNMARVLEPGRSLYIWGGYANVANYPPALKACNLYFSQTIIWVKEHPVLTRKDFMGNHEWCFYCWKHDAGHQWFGPNNATDVWSVKKVNPASMIHLTEKPVELAVRAIEYSSRPGENVLDLFGGSGSTLIAAEKTGRRAFLMELDMPYCDVIVDRFQRFSGKPAILERTGTSPIPMKPREAAVQCG